MSIIVVPTEAPPRKPSVQAPSRSGRTCHRPPRNRSLRSGELRSASVGTTGFPSVLLNPAYLKRERRITTASAPIGGGCGNPGRIANNADVICIGGFPSGRETSGRLAPHRDLLGLGE